MGAHAVIAFIRRYMCGCLRDGQDLGDTWYDCVLMVRAPLSLADLVLVS